MSTHLLGFPSFSSFLHHFVLAKLATTSIMVNESLVIVQYLSIRAKFLDYCNIAATVSDQDDFNSYSHYYLRSNQAIGCCLPRVCWLAGATGDDGDEENDDEYNHQAAHIVFTERETPACMRRSDNTLYQQTVVRFIEKVDGITCCCHHCHCCFSNIESLSATHIITIGNSLIPLCHCCSNSWPHGLSQQGVWVSF